MDEKKPKARRNDMIHCDNCGEDYASTYKRCPFCDEVNAGAGGRRMNNDRGGGYSSRMSPLRIVSVVVPLILIVAAIYIVITVVGPLIHRGNSDPGTQSSDPPVTQTVEPSTSIPPTDTPVPTDTVPPVETTTPDPSPSPSTPVTVTGATAITLNREDFTMSGAGETWNLQPQVTPAGASVTWTSSDPNVATVQNGVVTAVGGGTCTVTAASGSVKAECIVRVRGAASQGGTTTTAPTTPSTGGSLTLSRDDITLNNTWPSYTFTVTGASGSVSWKSSNSAVATVDANGTVTAVGNGTCTVTATSGGQSATCTVRVSR